MNRLQVELDRLYGLGADAAPRAADAGHDGTRALVLELLQPAGWETLAAAWKGVQADLELPAPAIAVSGVDALQLWFSLAASTPSHAGARFLDGLRARYLKDVAPKKLRLIADAAALPAAPPVEIGAERWSAFVTPDLAAVFAETPWLDVPPGDDGQTAILRPLQPIPPAAFEAALAQLAATDAARETPPAMPPAAAPARASADADPVRFLARVMNDETAPLALRIEAAKALLPHAGRG